MGKKIAFSIHKDGMRSRFLAKPTNQPTNHHQFVGNESLLSLLQNWSITFGLMSKLEFNFSCIDLRRKCGLAFGGFKGSWCLIDCIMRVSESLVFGRREKDRVEEEKRDEGERKRRMKINLFHLLRHEKHKTRDSILVFSLFILYSLSFIFFKRLISQKISLLKGNFNSPIIKQ